MGFDLAVATPAFLDLTVVGLESMPALGDERYASDLLRSPGGGAITAIGAARLGLRVGMAAPLAEDLAGDLVTDVLRSEGVATGERRGRRSPTTIVLPTAGDRAMVTIDPGVRANREDVGAFEPRAVSTNLGMLYLVPDGAAAYVTCGDDDARAYAGRPPDEVAGVHALFVSEPEALGLTGESSVEAAADRLGARVATVVVTLGSRGAIAVSGGERCSAPGFDCGPVVDATGAGDLLVAAYIWADLAGMPLEERLRWAVVYAGLSVTTPTAVAGAVDEARLLAEGARLGLAAASS